LRVGVKEAGGDGETSASTDVRPSVNEHEDDETEKGNTAEVKGKEREVVDVDETSVKQRKWTRRREVKTMWRTVYHRLV
jgi:hypothetical protein